MNRQEKPKKKKTILGDSSNILDYKLECIFRPTEFSQRLVLYQYIIQYF